MGIPRGNSTGEPTMIMDMAPKNPRISVTGLLM
jgi:hypothetical protein